MRRLETYHTFGRIANHQALLLADRVAGYDAIEDAKVFWVSGGSDAIDTAAKLARRHWQLQGQANKRIIISRDGSYHGLHAFGTSLAGIPFNREGYGSESLMPETARVPTNDADALEAQIRMLGPDRVAAVFAEPVIGTGGVILPAEGYLQRIEAICREHDVLLVLDEVITGFGRTGEMFAAQLFDVRPDMITMAKGITSGYAPLGGVLIAPRVWQPFFERRGRPHLPPRRHLLGPRHRLCGGPGQPRRDRGGGSGGSRGDAHAAARRRGCPAGRPPARHRGAGRRRPACRGRAQPRRLGRRRDPAHRCSFRVTEAAYCIERAMDILAQKLKMDPAELRLRNFVKREQFPYHSALGWEYNSGDYHTAMHKMMETVKYAELRKQQAEKRAAFKRGETREIMGVGVSFFTEIVGAGPSKNCDILGIAMFDSCEIRLHPTGAGIARVGSKSQGQGHETTWAQIIATEIGIPADNIMVEEGNTDTAPYGLGTYGSRSTPVAGAAIAMASRKIKAKAQMIAAYKLEVHEDDLEWDIDGFRVKGLPEKTMSMKDICWAAYNSVPPGMEPGLEAVSYYDPPNMTYPFGAYICVMDIDVDTGVYKIRRFYALDDCGTRINPMIIEGQVHGGLTEAFAIAMGQEIRYDDTGNVVTGSFMDFFMPTAVETPHWETDFTVTPSPHHPIGAKGVGESPNVGGVPAFSNAVNDAFSFLGSTHIQMPHDYWRNWKAAKDLGVFAA